MAAGSDIGTKRRRRVSFLVKDAVIPRFPPTTRRQTRQRDNNRQVTRKEQSQGIKTRELRAP
jgi:hypothetical protein